MGCKVGLPIDDAAEPAEPRCLAAAPGAVSVKPADERAPAMTATHSHPMTIPNPRPATRGRRSPFAFLGDSRGLTAAGAAALAVGAGIAGGLVDVATGEGLRATFAVAFVLGCALAAYKVHREDLLAAVVIPPLAYVALAVGANIGSRTTLGGSFLKQQVLELMTALVTKAPALLVATGLAAVIAITRRLAK